MKANNIGEFIQQIRKDKGMTQKDLAEQIGMSDKTISKWENSNSLPDTSVLLSLCEALDISVNELLSCEKLPPEEYSRKAEENIILLVKEKEKTKKRTVITGIALLVVGLLILLGTTQNGYAGVAIYSAYFFDPMSLLLVVIFSVAIVLISRSKTKVEILSILKKTIVYIGLAISLASAIIAIGITAELEVALVNIAVSMMALLYSCIIKIIVEIVLSNKLVE